MSSICHRCGKEFPDEDFITETGRKSVECNKCRERRKKYLKPVQKPVEEKPQEKIEEYSLKEYLPDYFGVEKSVNLIEQQQEPEKFLNPIVQLSKEITSLTGVRFNPKDSEKDYILNVLYFKSKSFEPFIVVIQRRLSTLEIVDFTIKHAKSFKFEIDFLKNFLTGFDLEKDTKIVVENNFDFMQGFLEGLFYKWQLNDSLFVKEDLEKVLKILIGVEKYNKEIGDFSNYWKYENQLKLFDKGP
jgi:hypothetical protein